MSRSRPIALHCGEPRLTVSRPALRAMLRALDAAPGPERLPPGELSVAFLDPAAMSRVHDRFFQDPSLTDVITFPGDPDGDQAGEICVCPSVAWAVARRRQLDFSAELALYVLHGWLHLAGHDDLDPGPRRRMRAAERRWMLFLRERGRLPPAAWSAESGDSGLSPTAPAD